MCENRETWKSSQSSSKCLFPAEVWKLITNRIPNSFLGQKQNKTKKAISLHHFHMWLKLLSSLILRCTKNTEYIEISQ